MFSTPLKNWLYFEAIFLGLLFLNVSPLTASDKQKVVVFKMGNASTYHGKWNISKALTEKLKKKINQTLTHKAIVINASPYLNNLNVNQINIKRERAILNALQTKHDAKIGIIASIEKFEISRMGFLLYALGGFDSHESHVKVRFQILSEKHLNRPKNNLESEKKIRKNKAGIAAFGGPGTPRDVQYFGLMGIFEASFNIYSDDFDRSSLGLAVDDVLNKMVKNLSLKAYESLPVRRINTTFNEQQLSQSPTPFTLAKGKIVDIDKKKIYVNLGEKDNVYQGQTLLVYSKGLPIKDPKTKKIYGYRENEIGLIEIKNILDNHLSKASVVKFFRGNRRFFIGQLVKPKTQ